jgi:hypothetical protein
MRWPLTPGPKQLEELFEALPSSNPQRYLVDRFPPYRHQVPDLPPDAQKVILRAADFVINSLLGPEPVVGILLRGHADQDLLKSGDERLRFEKRISEERASAVHQALWEALLGMSWRLQADPDARNIDSIAWKEDGKGATMLVVQPRSHPPLTEYERSLNRRVEIMYGQAWCPRPPSVYPGSIVFSKFEAPSVYPDSVQFSKIASV